jgi:hypothetical protein
MCKCSDKLCSTTDLLQSSWVLVQFSLLLRCATLRDRSERDGIS